MASPASPRSSASPTARLLVLWPATSAATATPSIGRSPQNTASFSSSLARRALSLPIAPASASIASGVAFSPRDRAVARTSSSWP